MEVNLAAKEAMKPHSSSKMLDASSHSSAMIKRKEENKIATEISMSDDNDDGLLLASLPKAEVKLKKLDESKLLMDNNENSLSVDALIDILSSSNETKPILDDIKSELMNIDDENFNMPPTSIPSTLDSPSPSSSSKTGFSSPTPNANESNTSSYTPSPKSSSTPHKKFPSPHYPNGGKPMMADLNKKMKQLSRRQPKPKAVYQSQISDNSVGIKLCIKKSINTSKMSPSPNNSNNSNSKSPRKRMRKSNKTTTSKVAEGASDSDDPYVKRRKKSSTSNNSSNKASFEEPIEQSVWGKDLPREILVDVSLFILHNFCLNNSCVLNVFYVLDIQDGCQRGWLYTDSMSINKSMFIMA